jgi:hypothetical protein
MSWGKTLALIVVALIATAAMFALHATPVAGWMERRFVGSRDAAGRATWMAAMAAAYVVAVFAAVWLGDLAGAYTLA